jgi:hypothetical protein
MSREAQWGDIVSTRSFCFVINPRPHHELTRACHEGIGSNKDRRTCVDSGDDS